MAEILHLNFRAIGATRGSKVPEFKQDLNYFQEISGDFCAWETLMNLAFNLVETSGFYAEAEENYRSRLHDVSHAIYGSYCTKLVTLDRKFRRKCIAVFHYLKVPCEVVSGEQFIAET
jgi:hypothetical protein